MYEYNHFTSSYSKREPWHESRINNAFENVRELKHLGNMIKIKIAYTNLRAD